MKSFGSISYALILAQNREKFDKKKGEKHLFIGYYDEFKTYQSLNPKTNKLVNSRDVVLDDASA